MLSRGSTPPQPDDDDAGLTPEEEQAYQIGLARVAEERRRALSDPGPTWKEWFFYDHAKWWMGLLFLVVDAWIITIFIDGGATSDLTVLLGLLAVAPAVYLEVLLYRYLWRRPSDRELHGERRFRPGWLALREFGRWTPEAERQRQRGVPATSPDGTPSPHEFL